MKTPSNKTQTKSKSKAKNNKKHQVVVYILRSIPKPIRFVLITIVIFLIYGAIHNWSTQQIAANYLRNKYNKEFNLRWDNSAPNWIGKPPTYHGLAKVKDGSDDVEFVVMCRIEGRECSDFYLRESWSRSEERSIKEYLKNDLPKGIKIDVDMISKVDEYDKKASIDDFDYYLKKHKERLLNHYLIKFEDYENDSDIETGKGIIKKTVEYINSKGITNEGWSGDSLRVSYRIIRSDNTYSSCSFDIKKEIDLLDNCFESGVRRKN